ncbi:MAG: glycogen debranching N-terminal domain-containing protein [Acidobacteriota bacterium]
MDLEGERPFFLGSASRGDTGQLAIALTNPDLIEDGRPRLAFGTLHISVRTFLWDGVCYQRITLKNYGADAAGALLSLHFAADFADIYEVRGKSRTARGVDMAPALGGDWVTLEYRGLDQIVRQDCDPTHASASFSDRGDSEFPGCATAGSRDGDPLFPQPAHVRRSHSHTWTSTPRSWQFSAK